jgi:hypothetical protein
MLSEDAPSSGAARMRTHRRRKRYGVQCFQITMHTADIDCLVAKGHLSPAERGDVEAIETAASQFLSDALSGRAWTVTRNGEAIRSVTPTARST